MTFRRALGWAVVLILLFSTAGCGNKGPVQPLGKALPEAPKRFRIEQHGERLVLSWDAPQRNQDGSALDNLDAFILAKAIVTPDDQCPTCERDYDEIAQVSPELLKQARRIGQRYYYWDPAIRPEMRYLYRVLAQTTSGKRGASAKAERVAFIAPEAPIGLKATGHDQHVQLTWEPVEGASGYRLYRKAPDGIFDPWPLNATPRAQEDYTDFTVANDTLYHYGVRAVWSIDGNIVESDLSQPASAEPQAGR